MLIFCVGGRSLSWDSLCNLYNWRYKNLGNLPHVQLLPEFSTANAGLLYDFQLINVEDFQGVGESEPNPYFYQVTPGGIGVCLAFAWLKYHGIQHWAMQAAIKEKKGYNLTLPHKSSQFQKGQIYTKNN